MSRFIQTILLAILLLSPCAAMGATYTVCASGCSETTIQAVLDNNDLAPGDIVIVSTGTYREQVTWGANDGGSSVADVTLQCDTGATCIISGADIFASGSFAGPDGNGEYTIAAATEVEVLIVDGAQWVEGTAGSLGASEWDWNANVLYLGSDPAGKIVEGSQREHGIYNADPVAYVTIDGFEIYGTGYAGIRFGNKPSYITVKNCNIHDNEQKGVLFAGTSESAADMAHHITISDNTFSNNAASGNTAGCDVCFGQSYILTINGNTMSANNNFGVDGILYENGGCGSQIYDNVIYSHDENAIDMKDLHETDSEGVCWVYNNNITDGDLASDGFAVLFQDAGDAEGTQDVVFGPGNYIHSVYAGIQIMDTDTGGIVIRGNVFYDIEGAQAILDLNTGAGGNKYYNNTFCKINTEANVAGPWAIHIRTDNPDIRNNIFIDVATGEDANYECAVNLSDEIDESTVTFEYNLFDQPEGVGSNIAWYDGGRKTMTTLKSNDDPLCNSGGTQTCVETTDSKLKNVGTDFRLTGASPAVNAGDNTVLSDADTDYAGRVLKTGTTISACGGTVDIGPNEFFPEKVLDTSPSTDL